MIFKLHGNMNELDETVTLIAQYPTTGGLELIALQIICKLNHYPS